MKAVTIDPEHHLNWSEVPDPVWKPGYVVIEVKAAGVNRADLLQAAGKYPPPPGWPEWPGLECAGTVTQSAPDSCWKIGDRVCALLGGGGYAEKVLVPEGMVMPLPDGCSFAEAACLPEVYTTALLNLVRLGELKKGETVFIQSGASGLGIAATQIAKLIGEENHSRLVGKVLSNASSYGDFPCPRVVNHNGRLAPGFERQEALLKSEGVTFRENGHVDLKKHQWNLD